MRFARIAWLAGALVALLVVIPVVATSCAQTPTNVAVRTFEQAQRMDLVCMAVNDDNGNPLPPSEIRPLPVGDCPPVPTGWIDPQQMPSHLCAVVTQTTPGTLAVVDLTAQTVIDEDNATPGINFIPVGQQPSDVAVSQDGTMTFVTSADPLKPAIYAIDNRRLLGTSNGYPPYPPLRLTDLPACALPQQPYALQIQQLPSGSFVLDVMLGVSGSAPARVAVYDPGPLMRAAGVPIVGSDAGPDAGPVDHPGLLTACTLLGASSPLADSSTLPPTFTAGPAWPDGVPYVDGGVNLAGQSPPPVPIVDGGAGACVAPPSGDGGLPFSEKVTAPAKPSSMVLRSDTPILYVADGAVPMIHVLDVSDPTNPKEQAPLLATSIRNPSQINTVGAIALSPPTRDYKRYLYAVDTFDGSVMVFDVTDPVASPHVPMVRPHAELNPFLPPDRITFSAPAVTLAFVEHDWLLPSQIDTEHYYGGILCNPNPNAHPGASQGFLARGAYYRADQAGVIQNTGTVENFPTRLRGVFAFVTLSNGAIVPIDVDDWDAPCRRPDPMTDGGAAKYPDNGMPIGPAASNLWSGKTGLLDIPEPPPSGPQDFSEYHAPVTYQADLTGLAAVTEEAFFPVSAPHRLRSQFLLENDPSAGSHMPDLVGAPQLFDQNGAPIQTGGSGVPLLLPTVLDPGFVDPTILSNPTAPDPGSRTADIIGDAGTLPSVRVQFEDPTAHIDQDWTVTFEGPLPASAGAPLDLQTSDGYQSLILTNGANPSDGAAGTPTPGFCAWGIEDWTIGTARAQAAGAPGNAAWTADYVEIADDLLDSDDPYWSEPYMENGQVVNDCWGGTGLEDSSANGAQQRFNTCSSLFGSVGVDAGSSGVGTIADEYPARDFPIVQAYDDRLVLGRFGWDPNAKAEQPFNRQIVGPDPTNESFLKLARCCFHHQASFKVRTGGEWVLLGVNNLGLIHHVSVAPNGACQLSCDPLDALKNARALDLSSPVNGQQESNCKIQSALATAPGRNDPQAVRNPMFAFYIQPATGTAPQCPAHTLVTRDTQWRFSMRGGFSPISISLTGGAAVGVSPQSMHFVEPFGQLAVVDGSQQGLVLIDLNTLGFAHAPYF